MSDKAGRMFQLPDKTPKSDLRSTPASTGKNDSSEKSKNGRKVQFGTEGSPDVDINFSSGKSEGKFATPLSKGGKGDKASNGGKTPVAKEAQPLMLVVEKELPENANCLMDCEAYNILEGIHDQMVVLSSDASIKLPKSFGLGLRYAKTGSHYTNSQSVRKHLRSLLKYGASDIEICVMANTCPEIVDEVFALVPSLWDKERRLSESLIDVLDELVKLKRST